MADSLLSLCQAVITKHKHLLGTYDTPLKRRAQFKPHAEFAILATAVHQRGCTSIGETMSEKAI